VLHGPLLEDSPQSVNNNNILYVFYDFETTQNKRYSEKATVHVPNLVCLQQFCLRCEGIADIDEDCEQCGVLWHSFWEDPVGDLSTLGLQSHSHRSQCKGIRSAVYSLQGDALEVETRNDYVRDEDLMHEDGTSHLPRLSVLHSEPAAQIARSVWTIVVQIVVSSLF
jgi:hypothetical protein